MGVVCIFNQFESLKSKKTFCSSLVKADLPVLEVVLKKKIISSLKQLWLFV